MGERIAARPASHTTREMPINTSRATTAKSAPTQNGVPINHSQPAMPPGAEGYSEYGRSIGHNFVAVVDVSIAVEGLAPYVPQVAASRPQPQEYHRDERAAALIGQERLVTRPHRRTCWWI